MAGKMQLAHPTQSPEKNLVDQKAAKHPHRPTNEHSTGAPEVPLPPIDVLQSALLYLLSRYSRTGCSNLMPTIVQHLRLIEAHPDSESESGVLRTACRCLANEWMELRYVRELRLAESERGGTIQH